MMGLLDQLKKDQHCALYCYKHPNRTCVLEEVGAVKKLKLEIPENLFNIINEFHIHNFKDDIGLTETNCLIRKHAPLVAFHKDLNKCVTICRRYQISFDFLLFKHKINYRRFDSIHKKKLLHKKRHIKHEERIHKSYN